MNTLNYSVLLPPLFIGAANLLCAAILHRTIVRDSTLLRRRHFFESLAVLAFLIALILLAAGFMLWRENPLFVLVCSGFWMLTCAVAVGMLRHRNRRRDDDGELAIPDSWPSLPERAPPPRPESRKIPASRPIPTRIRAGVATAPGDTGPGVRGRARLKIVRRGRPAERGDRSTSDHRFRLNRSVYERKDAANDSTDER